MVPPSSSKGGRGISKLSLNNVEPSPSFPPAAGTSAWGVALKTPRYTLLREEQPSPLYVKLFLEDQPPFQPLSRRARRYRHSTTAASSDAKVSSRLSPGAPFYSASVTAAPKITDITVWAEEAKVLVEGQQPPTTDTGTTEAAISLVLGGNNPIVSLPPPPGAKPLVLSSQPYVVPIQGGGEMVPSPLTTDTPATTTPRPNPLRQAHHHQALVATRNKRRISKRPPRTHNRHKASINKQGTEARPPPPDTSTVLEEASSNRRRKSVHFQEQDQTSAMRRQKRIGCTGC